MLKRIFLILSILFVTKISAQEPESCDLIFQTEDKGAFSGAITDATAPEDSVKFIHVGIIETDENGCFVYEASPKYGVRKIPYDEFINQTEGEEAQLRFVVKRLSIDIPKDKILQNIQSHLGEDYDWWFLPNNGKTYCSELVYDTFIDLQGNHIFSSQPMNFRAKDGSLPEFWTRLFEELNMPVPEGIEGTNPNDMAKDPRLIEIVKLTL